jgi:hypothetical protein
METGVNTFGRRFFEAQDRLIREDREWRATHAGEAIPVPRAGVVPPEPDPGPEAPA